MFNRIKINDKLMFDRITVGDKLVCRLSSNIYELLQPSGHCTSSMCIGDIFTVTYRDSMMILIVDSNGYRECFKKKDISIYFIILRDLRKKKLERLEHV